MTKNTKRTLNLIAPPPPPPLYIHLLNRCVVVSPKTARSLRQAFLAKIPKLAVFSALLTRTAAPLNREQKGSGLFVFHRLPSFLLSSYIVLGLFLFTHCYKGGGGINPYLGDRLPPDTSDGLAIPAPPPCQDSEFRGDGSFLDPYVVCSPQLFYEMANRNEQGTYFVLSQDIDLGGVVQAPLFDPAAPCGDPMSFRAFLGGRETRIINYRMDITQSGIYHPTNRQGDLFGVCLDNVDGIIVDFRSPYEVIRGCGVFTNAETGGFGRRRETETGPFLLCSLEQLEAIDDDGTNLARDYFLMRDIDLNDKVYDGAVVDGVYRGDFDGNDKTISNLRIESTKLYAGFFRQLGRPGYSLEGSIRNLKLRNVYISGAGEAPVPLSGMDIMQLQMGAFAATAIGGVIENCSVTPATFVMDMNGASNRQAYQTGGLVGRGNTLKLRDSYVEMLEVFTSGDNSRVNLGGLVGRLGHDSGLSGTDRDSEIERCYAANSELNPSTGGAKGGLIGLAPSSGTTNMTDSYSWNSRIGDLNEDGVIVGGLIGSASRVSGMTQLNITNSYTSYQVLAIGAIGSTISMGGLLGVLTSGDVNIRNSFSPTSFVTSRTGSSSLGGNTTIWLIGGLIGAATPAANSYTVRDSYFTGEITCGPRSYTDRCGGLVGQSNYGAGLVVERSYSAAQVTAHAPTHTTLQMDRVGLLMGSESGSGVVLPANLFPSDTMYFIRDRLRSRGNSYVLDSANNYIQSASQACADIDTGTTAPVTAGGVVGACPAMRVNDNMGTLTGTVAGDNRGLTRDQMQTVPDSSTNDGNSPAKLGDAFLYTAGWCPRVCRRGVTPCTDETSLVGFDASGQPLPGPGGGLIAQANNEGEKCFDVDALEPEDAATSAVIPTTPGVPLPPPLPPLMSLRACTVSGSFSANFIALASSVNSTHSSPSDPSANDTLSVRFNKAPQQTGVAATVTGTAASLNVAAASIPAGNFMGGAVTVDIQVTALDVSSRGTLCMDESTTEIGVDLTVSGSTIVTVPNGTYTGGATTGDTLDGCALSITQAATMSGQVAEAQLDNCILVTPANSDTPASLISVKFQLEIP